MKIIQTNKYKKEAAKIVVNNKQLLSKLVEVYKMLQEDVFLTRN